MAPTEILAEQHLMTLTQLLGPLGVEVGAPHQRGQGQGARAGARGRRGGRDRLRGRHPRPGPGGGELPAPRAGRRRRAAPLRRAPARDAQAQGREPGRAGDDRHADPAHARPDAVRRSRRLGDRRAAARAQAGASRAARPGSAAREDLPVPARAGERRPPGLRGLPAGGGVGGRSTCRPPPRWPSACSARSSPISSIGLLHGRMPFAEKDRVMREFKAGAIHVLVSTTVIEVGIDVPNASVMLVEHAERFGLSQLHQLRGRVGRGPWKSYCILLSGASSEDAKRRARGDDRHQRRLQDRRGGPVAAGPGRFLRHPPVGPARVPRRRSAARRRRARGRAPRRGGADPRGSRARSRPPHRGLRAALLQRWRGKLDLAGVG